MSLSVLFYGMRHGLKNGDALTEEGVQMVRDTALIRLGPIRFSAALSSGMKRTKQTVGHALDAINQKNVPVEVDFGFGYSWATGDANCPHYPQERLDPYPKDQSGLLTVGDCKRLWAPCHAYGPRIEGALLSQAIVMAQRFPAKSEVIRVLVSGHSPCLEMAAPDAFPRLRETDIVKYEVAFNRDGFPELVDAHYMPRPE